MTSAGAPVSLPDDLPPGILTVRIRGVAADPASRLVTLIDRGPTWTISSGGQSQRLVIGTAGQPGVLGATVDVGYREALALGRPPVSVVIGPAEGAPGSGSPLTLEFEVIPLSAAFESP